MYLPSPYGKNAILFPSQLRLHIIPIRQCGHPTKLARQKKIKIWASCLNIQTPQKMDLELGILFKHPTPPPKKKKNGPRLEYPF